MNNKQLIQLIKALDLSSVSKKDKSDLINALQGEKPKTKKPGKKVLKSIKYGAVEFTEQEIQKMPKFFKQEIIIKGTVVKWRQFQGLFQIRYRKKGICIEVSSKDIDEAKKKFIKALSDVPATPTTTNYIPQVKSKKNSIPTFETYSKQWLMLKTRTIKPSTYKEYERMLEKSLIPRFGERHLNEITRMEIQNYLFEYVDENKVRTAEKNKLLLNCIFDMAIEDFGFPSPMKKIELPFYESKKGSAFTIEEEKQLVSYCITNKNNATSSALLVLLYFGLRKSELASLKIIDDTYLQCETSKERKGRNVVLRTIPFTPVFKRVLPYVDFNKAKNANLNSIASQLKRIFPTHHTHELRYTFISRCKECGVYPEVVMLWDGHCQDKDVKSSVVDRGYTDYSSSFLLSEAQKVNYKWD